MEIEHKFLVRSDSWKTDGLRHARFVQGYLPSHPFYRISVRIRIADDKAWLTLKGPVHGMSRSEFEYEIPQADASAMIREFVSSGVVEKYRYYLPCKEGVWEIDEYLGDNEGLVTAELEVPAEDTVFERPEWLGREVTGVGRYYNSALARCPWNQWTDEEKGEFL